MSNTYNEIKGELKTRCQDKARQFLYRTLFLRRDKLKKVSVLIVCGSLFLVSGCVATYPERSFTYEFKDNDKGKVTFTCSHKEVKWFQWPEPDINPVKALKKECQEFIKRAQVR